MVGGWKVCVGVGWQRWGEEEANIYWIQQCNQRTSKLSLIIIMTLSVGNKSPEWPNTPHTHRAIECTSCYLDGLAGVLVSSNSRGVVQFESVALDYCLHHGTEASSHWFTEWHRRDCVCVCHCWTAWPRDNVNCHSSRHWPPIYARPTLEYNRPI